MMIYLLCSAMILFGVIVGLIIGKSGSGGEMVDEIPGVGVITWRKPRWALGHSIVHFVPEGGHFSHQITDRHTLEAIRMARDPYEAMEAVMRAL